MLAIERQRVILEKIKVEGSVRVVTLSKLFEVTEETIRRDLDKLEKEQKVKKTYGGAVLFEQEKKIEIEQGLASQEKIAQAVVNLIQDEDIVMLDAGAVSLDILKKLESYKHITVITNGLIAMNLASKLPGVNLIGVGGTYRPNSFSFAGSKTKQVIEGYYADKVVLSCKAIHKNRGVMDWSEAEAEVKQSFVKAAKEVIVTVEHDKIDKSSLYPLLIWSEVNYLVTDGVIDEEWKALCHKEGIRVIVAE